MCGGMSTMHTWLCIPGKEEIASTEEPCLARLLEKKDFQRGSFSEKSRKDTKNISRIFSTRTHNYWWTYKNDLLQ
jgi:hypothetical protein